MKEATEIISKKFHLAAPLLLEIGIKYEMLQKLDKLHCEIAEAATEVKQDIACVLKNKSNLFSKEYLQFQHMFLVCFRLEVIKKPLSSIIYCKKN